MGRGFLLYIPLIKPDQEVSVIFELKMCPAAVVLICLLLPYYPRLHVRHHCQQSHREFRPKCTGNCEIVSNAVPGLG